MTDEDLKVKWHALLFAVRRSARYHVRRRQFFDRMDFATKFLIIITGGATVISVNAESHNPWAKVFGSLVAVFSAIDLIIGCSGAARDHHDLVRRFLELEKEINLHSKAPNEELLIKLCNKRLEIEADEPPKLRILDLLCHNELIKSGGYPTTELSAIKFYQRWCCQFFDWGADEAS